MRNLSDTVGHQIIADWGSRLLITNQVWQRSLVLRFFDLNSLNKKIIQLKESFLYCKGREVNCLTSLIVSFSLCVQIGSSNEYNFILISFHQQSIQKSGIPPPPSTELYQDSKI